MERFFEDIGPDGTIVNNRIIGGATVTIPETDDNSTVHELF